MNYKKQIEKNAQSKWRKLIDNTDPVNIHDTVSEFNRNDRVNPWLNPINKVNFDDATDYGTDKKKIKQLISKEVVAPKPWHIKRETSLRELKPRDIRTRFDVAEDKMLFSGKRAKSYHPMEVVTKLTDPEEYVDIIHGTNLSKAKSFLNGGNGPSSMESRAMLSNGQTTKSGIQVHSRVKDRAPKYAEMAANGRGGTEAILKGKIQRKYLYPNPAGSGFGDEYGLPAEYWNKIKDARVESLYGKTLFEPPVKNKMSLPYGRTKSPGSKKSMATFLENNKPSVKKAKKGIAELRAKVMQRVSGKLSSNALKFIKKAVK